MSNATVYAMPTIPKTFQQVIQDAVKQEFLTRHPSFELLKFIEMVPASYSQASIRVDGKGDPIWYEATHYRLVRFEAYLTDLNVSTLDGFLRYLTAQIKDPEVPAETKEIIYFHADIQQEGTTRRLRRFVREPMDERVKHILIRAKKKEKKYIMTVTIAVNI